MSPSESSSKSIYGYTVRGNITDRNLPNIVTYSRANAGLG